MRKWQALKEATNRAYEVFDMGWSKEACDAWFELISRLLIVAVLFTLADRSGNAILHMTAVASFFAALGGPAAILDKKLNYIFNHDPKRATFKGVILMTIIAGAISWVLIQPIIDIVATATEVGV